MTSARLRLLAGLCAALLAATPLTATAQQDKNAERTARRLQLQLQNLQQQVQDAQAAKAKADADKAAIEKQLAGTAAEIPKVQGALRKTSSSLKAEQAARAELEAKVAALEKQLAEQKRSGEEALAARDRALAEAGRKSDAGLAALRLRHDEQVRQLGDCSEKNQRLVKLGAELLDRYRNKGLGDAMKQRDPLLGFSDVQMFNLVQDYRDKVDAERYAPPPAGGPSPPTPPTGATKPP